MLGDSQRLSRGMRQVHRHDNGALVCVDQNPATPLASISIRIGGGSAADPVGRSGLAHLFEHLFFTGTRRIGRDGYTRAVQDLGAECNAATSVSSTKFYETFSAELLAEVVGLETERFGGTVEYLTEAVLEREKAVVRRERSQRVEGTPYGDALEHLYRLLHGDTPLGRLPVGIAEEIDPITLEDCASHFRRCFRGGRITVAVSGNVDLDEAVTHTATLVDVFAGGDAAPTVPVVPAQPTGAVREVVGNLPPRVYLGYRLPPAESPVYDEVRLASYLLGKGQGSWLNRHLVGDGSVVSAVRISTLTRIAAPSVGVIEARPAAGVDIDRVRDRLRSCLAGLDDSVVGLADVARASAYYQGSWYADDDTTRGRADGLSLALLRSGDAGRYERELEPATRFGVADMAAALGYWGADRIAGEVVYR